MHHVSLLVIKRCNVHIGQIVIGRWLVGMYQKMNRPASLIHFCLEVETSIRRIEAFHTLSFRQRRNAERPITGERACISNTTRPSRL